MEDIEKPYHIQNKLNHPSIEDVAFQHNQLLNNMLSFPTKNQLGATNSTQSALRTPNDIYKDSLLNQIKTYKNNSTDEK